MKYGRSLQELAIELDRQAKVKKDYVATAGAMQMTAVNENFDLVIGNTPFQLNENAHRQLGLQLKIPAPYYERMRAENPGLLMANVNGWFQQSPDTRRMVRTLDGTARAILSDRYRRIDNYEVAQTVLPIISEMQGARIESCELTDRDGGLLRNVCRPGGIRYRPLDWPLLPSSEHLLPGTAAVPHRGEATHLPQHPRQ